MTDSLKNVSDIRSAFIDFFKQNDHTEVASSSLVPQNDPTLMFTNAGMVQFKDLFTGREKRDYSRAVTSQKCVRAGGKHNDLENVGYTARHHTLFEMLGNFSFGDYFKEEAISYAWELISKNFAIPQEKLLITVYHEDEEAADLWKKIAGFHDDRIIRIPTYDNFWMMGDTGPCGPCSEIFYDQGDQLQGGPPGSPEEDGDRFLEFWNLVFMQFEQEPDGNGGYNRTPLPKPSIDTGMGLERISALMQGKLTNYNIDLLRDIIDHSAELTRVSADGDQAASHRVIADHLRAASFLIADGVMPSNEGRGYVLRRIMRRGMRHAHILGASDPLMHKLFPTLLGKMSEAYPELTRASALITETLKSEEERFKATLERGLKILEDESAKVNNNILPGDVAFKLYDTFGFPLDLTKDALRAQGIAVDTDGFNACMSEQKEKARAAWKGSGDVGTEKLWFDILDDAGPTEFLGYETEKAEAQVLAIVKDGAHLDILSAGDEGIIITNQTPFYAESGGQVGDHGTLKTTNGAELAVIDTRKQVGTLFLHIAQVTNGTITTGDAVEMIIDHNRRTAIQANHSVTHLLHEALRETLGEHVAQKGSLQDENRTRFDISHNKAITPEELQIVEDKINAEINANTPVITRVMPIDAARDAGAMALFGEKYDDEVRVVSMGTKQNETDRAYSIELCGGTHVKETGEIGRIKITSEGALSSGVRRIEAVTGIRADSYEAQKSAAKQAELDKLTEGYKALKSELVDLGGTIDGDAPSESDALKKENKRLKKQIGDLRRQKATAGTGTDDVKTIGDIKFIGKVLEGFPARDLKPMADTLKGEIGSGVVVLIATDNGKASIVVGVTDDLTSRINAVDLVRAGSEALGGKGGGGRPDMAQAGGPNADAANDAVHRLETLLS